MKGWCVEVTAQPAKNTTVRSSISIYKPVSTRIALCASSSILEILLGKDLVLFLAVFLGKSLLNRGHSHTLLG